MHEIWYINTNPRLKSEGEITQNPTRQSTHDRWVELSDIQSKVALRFKNNAERLAWWMYGASINLKTMAPAYLLEPVSNPHYQITSNKLVSLMQLKSMGKTEPLKAYIQYHRYAGGSMPVTLIVDWASLMGLSNMLTAADHNSEITSNGGWSWDKSSPSDLLSPNHFTVFSEQNHRTVFELSPSQIKLFRKLLYADGNTHLSQKEAAKLMGCSVQTVNTNISQGRLFAHTQPHAGHRFVGIPRGAVEDWLLIHGNVKE